MEDKKQDTPTGKEDTPQGPAIRVMAQYVKDLSFENPTPLGFGPGQDSPAIELGIDVKADPFPKQPNAYEVTLRLSAQANREEQVVFIAELIYGGLFQLEGAAESDVEPILLVECPRLLFPFARRIMAEITREGGFPPLMIDPVDFLALYRQQRVQAAQNASA